MSSSFTIAIHALVYLRKTGKQLSSEALAEHICVNAVRVRTIMSKLKQAGLIETREGNNGGYRCVIQEDAITLAQIYQALHLRLCNSSWASKEIDPECMISSGMSDVMECLYDDMEDVCLHHLSTITIRDIIKQLEMIQQRKEG